MKLVVVESPYQSKNLLEFHNYLNYARSCMYDCIKRGEAPFLSHLLYTQVLDDDISEQRETGLKCGFTWGVKADLIAVYVDMDISPGMQRGMDYYHNRGIPLEMRSLETKEA